MPTNESIDFDQINDLLSIAIDEDFGPGDITTEAIAEDDTTASGRFVTREDAVIAGLSVVERVFTLVAERLARKGDMGDVRFDANMKDGDAVESGDVVAEVRGLALVLLGGERLALNFLQRMSGIATMTRRYVDAVKDYPADILDTRKTTPGWRYLAKYSVRMGGGVNHRMGLYDMVLIKDNHIQIAAQRWPNDDPIKRAVFEAKVRAQDIKWVEVEVESLDQVRSAIDAGADIIMFDNMTPDQMSEAVQLVKSSGKPILTEASGGITADRLVAIAKTGVERISIGALTHSAGAVDIALEM
ncbi:MAG: carboxylating nicotinate-nucleotide diphosphorylase [Planctomycetes bacterium]|nr:carboxylating nicotinate-nucleotide diphosphorylase [Planctomycetota bacterium]